MMREMFVIEPFFHMQFDNIVEGFCVFFLTMDQLLFGKKNPCV